MPLRYTEDPAATATVHDASDKYLIFYSSCDENGKMWCPDCRAVEEIVQKTFSSPNGPSGLIVYVGQRTEWKSLSNPFRGEPWKVESIPTVIRVEDGARLVLDEIHHGISSF
ncbi:hypothetical protein BC835DRAFT_1273059 [Cytidiella melzeri]|nr:hypothetical protein BC835DRAFT_1273059 [Cytidiella melzeri]